MRDEIENTLARYCWCYDTDQLDSIWCCLTPDAEVAFLAVTAVGREAVIEELRRRRARYDDGAIPAHALVNVYLREPQAGDVEVTSMYLFSAQAPGAEPRFTSTGYYHDHFRYHDGAWRISRRRIIQRLEQAKDLR